MLSFAASEQSSCDAMVFGLRYLVGYKIVFVRFPLSFRYRIRQDNVEVNTESVQSISIAYSEVRVTEISEKKIQRSSYVSTMFHICVQHWTEYKMT